MPDPVLGLKCQNPHHPPSCPRESMVCIREAPEFFVFGCRACLEVRHLESIQVKTRSRYRKDVRRKLAAEGKLLDHHPGVSRKLSMDESLRKEQR